MTDLQPLINRVQGASGAALIAIAALLSGCAAPVPKGAELVAECVGRDIYLLNGRLHIRHTINGRMELIARGTPIANVCSEPEY